MGNFTGCLLNLLLIWSGSSWQESAIFANAVTMEAKVENKVSER